MAAGVNGPEHYREAEQLAARAYHFIYGDGGDPVTGAALPAAAQVHATLALAAATALLPFCNPDSGREDFDLDAWREAAGARRGQHDGPCACDHHGDHAGCGADCECVR